MATPRESQPSRTLASQRLPTWYIGIADHTGEVADSTMSRSRVIAKAGKRHSGGGFATDQTAPAKLLMRLSFGTVATVLELARSALNPIDHNMLMKDYKGRGSNLQFRERSKRPHGRLVLFMTTLAVVAAGIYFGQGWLHSSASPSTSNPRSDASTAGDLIPLDLPPAPPGYGTEVASPPARAPAVP
jgi:hypothetical protein